MEQPTDERLKTPWYCKIVSRFSTFVSSRYIIDLLHYVSSEWTYKRMSGLSHLCRNDFCFNPLDRSIFNGMDVHFVPISLLGDSRHG